MHCRRLHEAVSNDSFFTNHFRIDTEGPVGAVTPWRGQEGSFMRTAPIRPDRLSAVRTAWHCVQPWISAEPASASPCTAGEPLSLNAAAAILVVDDDLDTCRNLTDIFSDEGYRVHSALDGPQALHLANERQFDVVLMDWRMPGMDGLTLCRKLLGLRPALITLLVTGYPNEILRRDAQAAGIRAILPKPIHVPMLLATIAQSLLGRVGGVAGEFGIGKPEHN